MLILATTFGVCFLGGVFPAISSEVYLIGAAALVTPALLPAIVLVGTAGQLAGKAIVYVGASRAAAGVRQRVHRRRAYGIVGAIRWAALDRALRSDLTRRVRERLGASSRAGDAAIAFSGLVGIPPLYAVAVASGAARFGLTRFLLVAGIGRLLRHGLVAALPVIARGIA